MATGQGKVDRDHCEPFLASIHLIRSRLMHWEDTWPFLSSPSLTLAS
jgi:hypothetical protein